MNLDISGDLVLIFTEKKQIELRRLKTDSILFFIRSDYVGAVHLHLALTSLPFKSKCSRHPIGLTVPCITAATPSTEVHLVAQGVPTVLLDALEQVGQLRRGLDLGDELVELWVFVCTGDVEKCSHSPHGRTL